MRQARFGRFEIVRRLSRSMTDVYLARDTLRQQTVVLKIIENCHSAGAQAAVEAEARGARLQQHLHARNHRILRVYEWGDMEDCFFVVLEYFAGRTLSDVIAAEGRIQAGRAAALARQVCLQLETLHEFTWEGRRTPIIHGDIKPSNIQIGDQDELKLLDFGIAKIIKPGHDLTQHQMGSPSYCSPERIADGRVDVQADLWALGVSLYEMLAGVPPFQAESTRQLEKQIEARQPPPPLPPQCPSMLRAIVAKSLAGPVANRYATAAALGCALEEFLAAPLPTKAPQGRTVVRASAPPRELAPVKPPQPEKKRDWLTPMAALLAGVLAGLLLFVPVAYYLRQLEMNRALGQRKDYVRLPASALATDWQRYKTIAHGNSRWSDLFPSRSGESAFHNNLLASADNVVSGLPLNGGDPLRVNWTRVRLCLLYALEIDPNQPRALGELHLANGYLILQGKRQAGTQDAALREFRRAQALLPRSPVPHLGLAHIYVYSLHNVGAARTEFHHAQTLGLRLGPREQQQEADALLYRAETELDQAKRTPTRARREATVWLRRAQNDFQDARILYTAIGNSAHATTRLSRIDQAQNEQQKLEAAWQRPVRAKSHMVLLKVRYLGNSAELRWQ